MGHQFVSHAQNYVFCIFTEKSKSATFPDISTDSPAAALFLLPLCIVEIIYCAVFSQCKNFEIAEYYDAQQKTGTGNPSKRLCVVLCPGVCLLPVQAQKRIQNFTGRFRACFRSPAACVRYRGAGGIS